MPFSIGIESSIPTKCRQYWKILEKCFLDDSLYGKTGYLSIKESFVQKGQTHRKAGLHVDKSFDGWGNRQLSKGGIFMASTVENSTRIWQTRITNSHLDGTCEHLRNLLGTGELCEANELIWITDECPHESLPVESNTYRQFFRYVASGHER